MALMPPDFVGGLVICAIGFLVGLVLLIVGRRGRRIGDYSVCRRCEYDLTGLPRETVSCPECGARLHEARATAVGHKKPRPVLLTVSIMALLPSLFGLTYFGHGAAIQIDWQRHKPVWWLMRDSASGNAARRDAAIDEMIRRIREEPLSQSKIESMASLALAHQSDLSHPWLPAWGSLVEAAHSRGKLSDATWKQYCIGAVALSVSIRPKVRRGDPLIVALNPLPARASTTGGVNAVLFFSPRQLHIHGASIAPNAGRTWHSLTFRANGSADPLTTWEVEMDEQILKGIADGVQEVDAEIQVTIYNHFIPHPLIETEAPVADVSFNLHTQFTVLPSNQSSVELVTDDSLQSAIEQSIRIGDMQDSSNVVHRTAAHFSSTMRAVGPPPLDLAFDVALRFGKTERHVGQFTCDTTGHGISDFEAFIEAPNANTVDVVLRPNTSLAAKTMDMSRIWGKEIVIHDVPVAETSDR